MGFVDMLRKRASYYSTNNLLFPFGNDFTFINAHKQYKNMDKLIFYINLNRERYNVHIQYSGLNNYFDILKKEKKKWPKWEKDFFPYGFKYPRGPGRMGKHTSYWTGYFTSRSRGKDTVRQADAYLRTAEFLHTFARAH